MHFSLFAEPGVELSGGSTTVFNAGPNAFGMPLANISRLNRRAHVVGNSFFNKNWVFSPSSTTARDGLGPLFHARSCSSCHVKDGRGAPTNNSSTSVGLLFRLGVPGKSSGDPVLGVQLATKAAPGIEPEGTVNVRYEEKEVGFDNLKTASLRKPKYELIANDHYGKPHAEIQFGPRIAQQLVGVGLLEAVTDKTILANADPNDEDEDGISGKPNFIYNPESKKRELGRFGWKANEANLRTQTASAFLRDMGITSPIHPIEDFTKPQKEKINVTLIANPPDIDDSKFERVVTYLRTLAPPAQRNANDPSVKRGDILFNKIGCSNCHIPTLRTGSITAIDELKNQSIKPYTDLLLHDMGEGLADGLKDSLASGSEWRTPPLWGIGLTKTVNGNTFFLHDGRARSIEEAILWHGGEGSESRKNYSSLSFDEKNDLLNFINSL
ncbi:MAG: thiol oxidoreductase [Verrucomicrobiales bacterium]|nr:thiol oxidoreductase [Verrucomicrobiales bacterium]